MTNETTSLRAHGEDPDADLSREMIGFVAQRLVDLEVESRTGGLRREER